MELAAIGEALSKLDYLDSSYLSLDGFIIPMNSNTIKLASKIESNSSKINAIADVFYGIKVYEEGKGKPPQTRDIVNNKPFTSDRKKSKEWLPFYDGKDITRFKILWKGQNWIHYGPWVAAPRNPKNFEGEKLLIRKIVGKTLFATFFASTSYCNTLVYVLKIFKESEINYLNLLGIINSYIIGWYIRSKLQISHDDIFPQIMKEDILSLPISRDVKKRDSIRNLTKEIIKRAENGHETLHLEAQLDALIAHAYGLTEEEYTLILNDLKLEDSIRSACLKEYNRIEK